MSDDRRASAPLILISILLALVLSKVMLPDPLALLRPAMVPMIVFYWLLMVPDRFGLTMAAVLGLVLDVLTGTLLGAHAFALTVSGYLVARMALIVRFWPAWQQSLALLPMWGLYAFLMFWIDGVTHRNADALLRFAPVLTTAIAWPLLCALMSWANPPREDA